MRWQFLPGKGFLTMANPVRVVKVGGSLLDLPGLEVRLQSWLDGQPAAHHVLVVGGGKLVDTVRRWNTQFPLDEETAHWICVDLMSVNSRLLQSRMPGLSLTDDVLMLKSRLEISGATFFDASSWLREYEPHLPGQTLPASWGVTSDTITGRLAVGLQASELVLLKSRLPDGNTGLSIPELVATGMVDSAFGAFVEELPKVRVVNMRVNPPTQAMIRTLEPESRNL